VSRSFILNTSNHKLLQTSVLSARSARGLSLSAYVLETLSCAITLAYSFRNNFPFSTYGENFFLTIQNVVIILLIIYYPTPSLRRSQDITSRLIVATLGICVSCVALYSAPESTLSFLQFATLPLSVFSKLPQIFQNARTQSTGQLSAFAVVSQIAGCLARLFTTMTEVGDQLVTAGYAIGLLLNCILGAQMWLYWGKEEKEKDVDVGRVVYSVPDEKKVEVAPPPPPSIPSSGRKWARKVD
jgi:mannose-P-dolichol utilization defect 1